MFTGKNKSLLLNMHTTIIKISFYILLLIFHASRLLAQSTYEPTYNKEIYTFLDKQAEKGIISFFDDIRPISRIKIAEKLKQLDNLAIQQFNNSTINLSSIEHDQLEFFKKEYAFEINFIKNDTTKIDEFFKFGINDRFNAYKYYDKNFTFDIDPIFQMKYDMVQENYMQFGGIKFKGRISDFVGFYFSYRDFMEEGKNIDVYKNFTPTTGVKNHRATLNEHSEYSETRGGITLGWKWGNFTFAKDWLNIGTSYQSSVILSDKVPSFPHIRLEIEPVSWFKYNFVHAWLDSQLIDSTTIRYSGVNSEVLDVSKNYSRRFKYYVSHTFSFQPYNNWWLTFGESIIYGDRLEPIYFIPLFLRLADHYNSLGTGDTGDNAQIFLNTSYRSIATKSKFYLTLFIDEFSPGDILGGGDNAQVFAITIGTSGTNPFWKDSYYTIEYSALRPYNYMNADPLQQYTSSNYQLGHWIGTNAQQLYFSYEQFLSRSIKLKTYFQTIQKGSKEDINNYYNRVTSTYPLLSGDVSDYSEIGLSVSYNPYHDFFLELDYSYIINSTGRFVDEYSKEKGHYLATSIRYGF